MLWHSFQLLIPFLILSLQLQFSCCTSYGVDHATHTHQAGTLETQSAHSAAITTEEFRKYLNAHQLDILMSLPRDYLLTVLAKQHVQLAHAHKTREELAHDTVVGAILDSAMQRSRAFHEHAKQIFILDDAKRRTEFFNSLKTTQSELRPKIESLGAGANKSSIGLEATKRYVCEDTDPCPVFILQKLHELRHLEWAYYRSRFVSELALFTVEDLSSILKYVKEHNPLRGKTLNLTEAFTTFITELDKNELKLGSPETIFRDTNPNTLDSVHVFDTAGDIRCMEKDLQRAIELKKQHGSESFFQTLQHAFFSTHITERVRLKDAMNTLRVLLGLNYGEALLSDSSFVRQVQEHIRSMYREMSFNASGNDEFNIFSLFRKPHSIVATFRHHFLKLHHRIADQLLELYSTFTPESKKINDIAHNPFARASTSRLALYNCLDLSRQDEDLTFLKSVDTSSESVTEGSSIWGGKCSDLLDGALRTEGVALLALSVTTSASLPLKAALYASLELRNFRHTVLEQLFYGLSYSELSGERTSEYNALAEWYVHKISVLNTLRNSLLLPDLEADVPKPLPFSSSTLRFHFDRHLYEARRLLSLSRMDFESMDAKAGALQWQMREAERTLLKKAEEMNFTSVRKLSENLSFAEEFYHSAIQPLYFFHDQGATQDAEVLERANEARIALDTLELSDEGLAPLANEESLRIRAAALRQVFSTMKDVHLLHHTENLNVLTLTLLDFVQVMERYTPSQFVQDEGLLNQIMVSTCNFVPFVLHQDGVNPIPNRDVDIHHCPSTVVSHFKSVRRSALDQARYHFLSMASRLDDVQLPALIQHVREKLRQREVPVEDVYAFPVIQKLRRLVADVHLLYTLEHRLEKLHDVPGSTEVGALVQQLQTSDVFTDEEIHHPMTIKRVAKKIQEAQKRYSVLIEKIMASRLIFRDGTVEQGGAQVEVLSRRLLDQGVALTVMHRDLCLIQLHRDEHQMRLMHDYITSMRFVKRRNTLLQRTQLGFLLGNNFYDDSSDTGKIYQLVRKLIHLEGSMVHIKALRYRLAGRKIPRSEELALAVDDLRKEIDHYHVQVATALENRIKSEHFFSPKDWTDDDPRSALPFAMRASQQESNNCYEEHEHAECSYIVEDHRHIVSWLWSTIQRDPPSLDILHDPILYLLYDMVTVMYVEEVAQNARGAGNYNLKVLLDRITELLNHVLRQLGIQESSQALEQTAEKTFSQDTIEQRVLSKGTEEHVDLPSTTLDLKGVDESIPDEMKNNVENYDDGALRSEARRLHDHAQEESSTRAGMPSEESPESMVSSNSKPPAAHKSSVAATEEGVLPPNEVETSSSLSSAEAVEALTIATEKEHEVEEALNQEMSISKFLSSKDKIVFIVGICLLVGAVVGAIIFGVAIYMLWHHRSHCSEVVRSEDEAPVTPSESNEFGKYNTSLN